MNGLDAVDLVGGEPGIGLVRLALDFTEHRGQVIVHRTEVLVRRPLRETQHDVERRGAAELGVDQLEALADPVSSWK